MNELSGKSITVTEVLQIMIYVKKGYPEFWNEMDVDPLFCTLSETKSDRLPTELRKDVIWFLTRFSQFLYQFPIYER